MSITKEVLLNTLSMYKKQADTYYGDKFVFKVDGKNLSTNDYTNAEKSKLNGISAGAQVNVIETISIDGKTQTITDKGVTLDLSAYAKLSDISGDTDLSNYVVKETGKGLSSNDFTTAEKNQLAELVANSNETISDAEITAIFAA